MLGRPSTDLPKLTLRSMIGFFHHKIDHQSKTNRLNSDNEDITELNLSLGGN